VGRVDGRGRRGPAHRRLRGYLQPEVESRCGRATADRQEIAANYRMNVLGYLRYFEKKHTPRP